VDLHCNIENLNDRLVDIYEKLAKKPLGHSTLPWYRWKPSAT
jgi:hypothetical protein